MVRGSAPITLYKSSLSGDEWQEKEKLPIAYLKNTITKLPTQLSSMAYLGYGVKTNYGDRKR